MTDAETFTRLNYCATVHLNRSEAAFWLTPIGEILDLWEVHKQHMGWAKPKRELCIDDFIGTDWG